MNALAPLVFGLMLAALPARSDDLLVFAAASLREALDAVNAAYGAAEITASYAGSSTLARQIEAGAQADVYISANPDWMDQLEERGQIAGDSRRDLLTNRLVVIGHGDAAPLQHFRDLDTALGSDRLAVALTQAVPAGLYARQALGAAGLWEALAPRLAETDNVRAALLLVDWGQAPYGIVYATDAAASPNVSVVWQIDPALHDPIRYPAAAVAGAAPGAADYLDFLSGEDAARIFARYGFGVVQ